MKSKVIAILETRTGEHLAELVARRGAIPLHAPALAEIPDIDPQSVNALIDGWKVNPYSIVIFQTGVGTRALFHVSDSLGVSDSLLRLIAQTTVIVRGPKPVGELNSRGVRIDIRAASPFTTEMVLEALLERDLTGARVLVQRYGATNDRLREALETRGASVAEIATYRWALPADLGPIKFLLSELAASRVDAVVFTSAIQVENLYAVAATAGVAGELAAWLNRLVVASIGPVCSRALAERGIEPTFEASPPKLGPLVTALERALSV